MEKAVCQVVFPLWRNHTTQTSDIYRYVPGRAIRVRIYHAPFSFCVPGTFGVVAFFVHVLVQPRYR